MTPKEKIFSTPAAYQQKVMFHDNSSGEAWITHYLSYKALYVRINGLKQEGGEFFIKYFRKD